MKTTISLSVILVAAILGLGDGASLPADNRGQRSVSIFFTMDLHYPEHARRDELLAVDRKIYGKDFPVYSQPAEPGIQQTVIYIVKWCFLCFLAENNDMLSEMADIQRALNQADTPSSMNTLIAVRTLIPSLLAENTLIYCS